MDFNVISYIEQFGILNLDLDTSCDNNLKCDHLSHQLYSNILNKFNITIDKSDYDDFVEYQERVYNLIENMRELDNEIIATILIYVNNLNPYLADIIIMSWCLPRANKYLSKRIYNEQYKKNIVLYNKKLIDNIENTVIKNFCIETLTKTNCVPVHCIDYLWYYMNCITLDLEFYNLDFGTYIGFEIPESPGDYTKMYLNIEYVLFIGLGKIVYQNDVLKKGSFRNFIKLFITDINIVKKLLEYNKNYRTQIINICKNPTKYFEDTVIDIPSEIIQIVNSL